MNKHLNPNQSPKKPKLLETLVINKMTTEQLFEKFMPAIHRAANKKGLSEEVEDIIQDVFMVFCEKNQKEVIRDSRAFLFKVLRNVISERCRKRKKDRGIFTTLDDNPTICDKALQQDPTLVKEIELAKKERIDRLLNIMEIHLNKNQRKVLHLKYFEEKSYREIATLLGKSQDAIRAISSRAEKKIKLLM